ncbi:MAG: tetratricopeptide repeat protein [Planctomycetes bacterium]|nr:tetratricopeptide repeat protein [Planctomycetota bacterium]
MAKRTRKTQQSDLEQAWTLNKLGKYQKAIKCLDKALETDPNNKQVWFCKGWALVKVNRYQEAIECFDEALEIDKKFAAALNDKAVALFKLGRYDNAKSLYRRAIKIEETWRSYLGLAKIYINIGDESDENWMYEQALVYLHMVSTLYPNIDKDEENKKDYYYQRGYAHAKLGHWRKAKRDFMQCDEDPKAVRNIRKIANRSRTEGPPSKKLVYGGWALAGVSIVVLIIFCVFSFLGFEQIDADLLKVLIPISLFFITVGICLPYIKSIKGPFGMGFEKATNIGSEQTPLKSS